ncbi:hypothetical protein ACWC9U_39620, partial [Streptomyces sp. 900116325]
MLLQVAAVGSSRRLSTQRGPVAQPVLRLAVVGRGAPTPEDNQHVLDCIDASKLLRLGRVSGHFDEITKSLPVSALSDQIFGVRSLQPTDPPRYCSAHQPDRTLAIIRQRCVRIDPPPARILQETALGHAPLRRRDGRSERAPAPN